MRGVPGMRVLIACEFSGTVRDAFLALGHDAVSCDLLPTERPGPHRQGDVLRLLEERWDLMIAFPPCTDLAASGAKWFHEKRRDGRQQRAVDFFRALADAPIPRVAVENPVGVMSTLYRKPDQIVHPWQFGDVAEKHTCLWLRGLPLLLPTEIVDRGPRHVTKSGRSLPKWYNLPPSPERAKIRSRTFPGLARAMAEQWGQP